MKKLLTIFAVNALLFGGAAFNANAQMMPGFRASGVNWDEVEEHTLREEEEGKELREKLQAKEIICADLSDHDFGTLGEYFMGTMMGDSHVAMNAMMMQTHGEEGEEQIHIVMGKRLSGCDTSAVFPAGSGGWMPMMNMLAPYGTEGSRTGMTGLQPFGYGFGFFGWLFMALWWVLIIAAIVTLVKWLTNQFRGGTSGRSALDILKERYAKGEINKQEFEAKKKDLEKVD